MSKSNPTKMMGQGEETELEVEEITAEITSTGNISDQTLQKLKAKVESVGLIPKAVTSSLETMVEVDDGIDIVKEFTITGNTLTPLQLEGSECKKRPRCDTNGNDALGADSDEDDMDENESAAENDEEGYSDDEDYDDEDDEDYVIGSCLHCGLEPPPADGSSNSSQTAPGIQVSCDDCHSFICSACHWCHEYQANHEIRVCDRCDAFYCKRCDEMDQCEDCGEVVCGGCGSLCSCKFCGCGLCEDCATACGRCGIVLCQRDSKFAVECDTCKMSYCLVCLASGSKDPCVRCGQRTSKRVEQLVHLRLKSIYKAFKQSGSSIDGNTKGEKSKQGEDALKPSKHQPTCTIVHDPEAGNASANTRYAKPGKRGVSCSNESNQCSLNSEDVGTVLKVAAAAASSTSAASNRSTCPHAGRPKVLPHFSFRGQKEPKRNASDLHASRTVAEADAAAAALLAELDQEKQQNEASSKAKKNKKKKKKERQAAKEREKEEKAKKEAEEKALKLAAEAEKQKKSKENIEKRDAKRPTTKDGGATGLEGSSKSKSKKKKVKSPREKSPPSPDESTNEDSEEYDIAQLAEGTGIDVAVTQPKPLSNEEESQNDKVESRLASFISSNDLDGIESVLAELKGVPGRAALRKNAKKALKRIRGEIEALEASKLGYEQKQTNHTALSMVNMPNIASDDADDVKSSAYKAPEPLLKLVSSTHRVQSTSGGPPRSECVMHMAPSVVGWVIGKGGQRIRDLMEDSGAKVWIDQESMGAQDMRIVYVSGSKKSIDLAVRTIKDLVAKAPVGGTIQPSGTVPSTTNLSANASGTKSGPTSNPLPLVQNIPQQAPTATAVPSKKQVADRVIVQHSMPKPETHISPSPLGTMHPPGMVTLSGSSVISSISVNADPSEQNTPKVAPKVVQELFCEPRFVPLLIGRRGWTVKNIQDTSGARVDIDQKVIPRKIIISGDAKQVEMAVNLVSEVLSYPHAQSNYGTSGPGDGEVEVEVGAFSAISSQAPHEANPSFPLDGQNDASNQLLFPSFQQDTDSLSYGGILNSSGSGFLGTQKPLQKESDFRNGQQVRQQSFTEYMQSSQQQFPIGGAGHLDTPHAFISRQNSAPLPVRNTGIQSGPMPHAPELFNRNYLRENLHQKQRPAAENYQFDSVLPVHQKFTTPPTHFGTMPNNLINPEPMSRLNGASNRMHVPRQQQPNNDQDIVNDLFSRSMPAASYATTDRGPDSLLHSLGNLSFGESSTGADGLGFEGANWDWDGLMNDENSSNHHVGLGGVRLDTSTEMPRTEKNTSHFDSLWDNM